MASFVPTSPETFEDQRLYTRARLVEVTCSECFAEVGVKKNSDHHTSVQWNADALASCAEFANRDTTSGRRDMHRPCLHLVASIEAAVQAGEVPVGAQDGY